MTPFQAIAAQLLFDTGASRTMIQLGPHGGKFPIVAEAVAHDMRQIRDDVAPTDVNSGAVYQFLESEKQALIQNDVETAESSVPRTLIDGYGVRAQMVAPLIRGAQLAGIVSVHAAQPRQWEARDIESLQRAQSKALAILDEVEARGGPVMTIDELRGAAVQAILDGVRQALGVQRCTLRQNVLEAYAFPVTYESREPGVRSLYGDFTIVQSGQPVIEKMVRDRVQVVQDDTRTASAEPHFHTMLAHYGGMRAQIVTPMFRDDKLAAVLSIHYLKAPRQWTREEIAFARGAAEFIGKLFGATVA